MLNFRLNSDKGKSYEQEYLPPAQG